MKKGYWISHLEVFNPDIHKEYIPLSTAAVAEFGGTFIVRGGDCNVVEGSLRSRHVVIEFPSLAAAIACYESPAYAEALAVRANSAVADIVIVEGA